ncbi:hypothetical protein ABK040_014330 [Willaertia magna]
MLKEEVELNDQMITSDRNGLVVGDDNRKDDKELHNEEEDDKKSTQLKVSSSEHHSIFHVPTLLKGIVPEWTYHENKGSEARDMLAVERTNLGWVRTGLSTLAIGIAVSKLLKSDNETSNILVKIVGTSCTLLAFLLFIYSYIRFQMVMKHLVEGVFVADNFSPPFMLCFGVIVCTCAVILLFV